jgi:hypothetical protein
VKQEFEFPRSDYAGVVNSQRGFDLANLNLENNIFAVPIEVEQTECESGIIEERSSSRDRANQISSISSLVFIRKYYHVR